MKIIRYVGYLLGGTVWLFFGGIPIFPMGLLAVYGAWKDCHKFIAFGLLVLGMVCGFFGSGLSLRVVPEGKMTSFSIAPTIGFNPNVVQMYWNNLKFVSSGALGEGRVAADLSIDSVTNNNIDQLLELFDESFLGVMKKDLVDEVKGLQAQTGQLKVLRFADIKILDVPGKMIPVFQYIYVLKSEKTPSFALALGMAKRNGIWKMVSLNALPAQ
jgi:hypothetical protein